MNITFPLPSEIETASLLEINDPLECTLLTPVLDSSRLNFLNEEGLVTSNVP